MTQLPLLPPEPDPAQEAFEKFDRENPNVKEQLTRLALQLIERGHRRYSIAGLFEVLRFRHALKTTSDDFKLNNNYKPLYARMLMEDHSRLQDFFELRMMKRL